MNSKQSPPALHILLAALVAFGLVVFLAAVQDTFAQKASKLEIDQWPLMLRNVKSELKSNYYDPTIHGMDIEERFKLADEKMKQAESMGQLSGFIAQVLLDLNDSHTLFTPP